MTKRLYILSLLLKHKIVLKLLIFAILFLSVGCNTVKRAERFSQRESIAVFGDEKNFFERWGNVWIKAYAPENELFFKQQSAYILKNQMIVLESFIAEAKETESKKQAEYISNSFEYIKELTDDVSFADTIANLNNNYLIRAENHAKIVAAAKYADDKNYANWKQKWNELAPNYITEQYQLDAFVQQAGSLLSKQLAIVKNYINSGDESHAVRENNSLKSNYDYVRSKYGNYDNQFNRTEDLNDDYIAKVPVLVKMRRADIFKENQQYTQWRAKWNEIEPYSISVDYITSEFIKQSLSILRLQTNALTDVINNGNETLTETARDKLKENYDFVRQKYPRFDREHNDIVNLNDNYLQIAVNLSKISMAARYLNNLNYKAWIYKWSEIGYNISEQYLIDAFQAQADEAFSVLYQKLSRARDTRNCSEWEKHSDIIVQSLRETLKIYPGFDNYRRTKREIADVELSFLIRQNRDAKICIAENHLKIKEYNDWINKWAEINQTQLLNDHEINIFNTHTGNAFRQLLEDIETAVKNGNEASAHSLANTTLDLFQNKVLSVHPNYSPQYDDLNAAYLNNVPYFARAQNQFINENYKEGVEVLMQTVGEQLNTNELREKFTDFVTQSLQKLVEIYRLGVQANDFNRQVDDLKLMAEIYNIKPEYISITYTPDYQNPGKRYSPFKKWLDYRIDYTLNTFFAHADSLINQNLYTRAYDFVAEKASQLSDTEDTQKRINDYTVIFETQGTDYYKTQINRRINQNLYIIAQNILHSDLLKINKRFQTERQSEYNEIVNNIKNRGTNFYINQRDRMINQQRWNDDCKRYCDSIAMINPDYNINRCRDEITFEEQYFLANNNYNNRRYLCAISLGNELMSLDVGEVHRSRAQTMISKSEQEAVITINVAVENSYLNDDLHGFIINELQEFQKNYRLRNYFQITSSADADYTIELAVSNFNYHADWDRQEKRQACTEQSRNDQRTKTVTYQEKKTKQVGDYSYYVVSAGGNEFYIRTIDGYYYVLMQDGTHSLVNFQFDFLYEDKTRTEQYTVTQYRYMQVEYTAKYGSEKMNFSGRIELKQNDGRLLKYGQNQQFSNESTYTKYEASGNYNAQDLAICPNTQLNSWHDRAYGMSSFDKSHFDAPANPFEGRGTYYENNLKNNLRGFLRNHIPKALENIEEAHIRMQCN